MYQKLACLMINVVVIFIYLLRVAYNLGRCGQCKSIYIYRTPNILCLRMAKNF